MRNFRSITNSIASSITRGDFFYVFNRRNDMARSRSYILVFNLIVSANTYLTAGIFYSGFLAANGMTAVNMGIITMIPYISNILSILSPNILERFEHRKRILVISRFLYHTFNILGVTLIPLITDNTNMRIVWFAILIFIANSINALFQPGISIWHIACIPDDIRSDYFAYQQTCSAAMSGAVIIASSLIMDHLTGTRYELTALTGIRFAAYGLALLDVLMLALPKEPSYLHKEKIKLTNIFTLPFRHKPFSLTMLFVLLWNFTQNIAVSSILNNYLLNDCGVPYLFICIIDASYTLFLMFLSKYWKRRISHTSWLRTFALAAILHAPTTLLYAFVTGNNFWVVMLTVRLLQHVLGVGLNITYANIAYVSMPETDRTYYMSFNILISQIGILLGMGFGTLYIARMHPFTLPFVNITFGGVQQLLLLQALFQLLIPILMFVMMPRLSPSGTSPHIIDKSS